MAMPNRWKCIIRDTVNDTKSKFPASAGNCTAFADLAQMGNPNGKYVYLSTSTGGFKHKFIVIGSIRAHDGTVTRLDMAQFKDIWQEVQAWPIHILQTVVTKICRELHFDIYRLRRRDVMGPECDTTCDIDSVHGKVVKVSEISYCTDSVADMTVSALAKNIAATTTQEGLVYYDYASIGLNLKDSAFARNTKVINMIAQIPDSGKKRKLDDQ